LSGKWIKRQAHVSVKDIESSIEHYLESYNPKPFWWHKKAEEILVSVARAARATGKRFSSVVLKHHSSKGFWSLSTSRSPSVNTVVGFWP
jgi:hypothetical protein